MERETLRMLGRFYLLGFTGATGFVGSTGLTGAAGFTGLTGPAPRAVIALSYAVFAALVAVQYALRAALITASLGVPAVAAMNAADAAFTAARRTSWSGCFLASKAACALWKAAIVTAQSELNF